MHDSLFLFNGNVDYSHKVGGPAGGTGCHRRVNDRRAQIVVELRKESSHEQHQQKGQQGRRGVQVRRASVRSSLVAPFPYTHACVRAATFELLGSNN